MTRPKPGKDASELRRKAAPVLNAADAALWQQAAAAVRPLAKTRPAPALPRVRAIVVPGEMAPPPASARRGALMNATLDATWDRKTRDGAVQIDYTIDLHGMTQATAFAALARGIARAASRSARVVLVITGKGTPPSATWPEPDPKRGAIRIAFANWISTPDIAPYIASVRAAHLRHGGDGAWYVVLRRVRGS